MDWDFIIQCILAVGLSAALLALLDARLKLREEKRKTSMFYSISKDLEGDTWKQKDVIEEQSGTIVEQKSTIREQEGTIMVQNNTILEQKHEIESLETDLEESRTMARMLLQRGRENAELTAFTEKLLMLADETANIYYESASSPGNMSRRIIAVLRTELTDNSILPQINSLIEASYPGFTESLYSEFPWMTQDDRLLVSLMCCGVSPNAVSVILDTDLNRLNKWKTRLGRQMGLPVRLSKYLKDRLSSYRSRPLRKDSSTSAIA